MLRCKAGVAAVTYKGVSACSLTFKEMDFVPYGDTLDGSARRAKYVRDLEAYLGSALQPILEAWEGELPPHLQKVRTFDASTLAPPNAAYHGI